MKVLVLGAAGPAGVNTVKALRMAHHWVVGADSNPAHLGWLPCLRVLAPHHGDPTFIPWLNDRIREYRIDLVMAQPDPLVLDLAQRCAEITAQVALPKISTMLLCQDKFETGWRWAKAGLRQPVTRIEDGICLDEAADVYGLPLWLRATRGAGARGATKVETLEGAHAWLRYWIERDVDWEWIAEQYLPGRDYSWAGLYWEGELVTSFARERLEYIYPHLAPSGRTGTPTVARVVHDDRVNEVAEFAVGVIDSDPHGIFCVDLREDEFGMPTPTEINAGRTCTTVPLYAEVGCNIPGELARLAEYRTDEEWRLADRPRELHQHEPPPIRNAVPDGTTLARHIDCGHVFSQVPIEALAA